MSAYLHLEQHSLSLTPCSSWLSHGQEGSSQNLWLCGSEFPSHLVLGSYVYFMPFFFHYHKGFSRGSAGKESACSVGDLGSIPGLGRCPGEGKGCLCQYSGLENSMDYTVHGVTKSQTWLSNFHSLFLLLPLTKVLSEFLHFLSWFLLLFVKIVAKPFHKISC